MLRMRSRSGLSFFEAICSTDRYFHLGFQECRTFVILPLNGIMASHSKKLVSPFRRQVCIQTASFHSRMGLWLLFLLIISSRRACMAVFTNYALAASIVQGVVSYRRERGTVQSGNSSSNVSLRIRASRDQFSAALSKTRVMRAVTGPSSSISNSSASQKFLEMI
jgi:hypothetical protein